MIVRRFFTICISFSYRRLATGKLITSFMSGTSLRRSSFLKLLMPAAQIFGDLLTRHQIAETGVIAIGA